MLKPDHVEYSEIVENLKENYGCENLDDISLSGKCVALRQLLLECGIGGQIGDEDEDRSIVRQFFTSIRSFQNLYTIFFVSGSFDCS